MSELQNALDIIRICAYRNSPTASNLDTQNRLNSEIINQQIRRLNEENISVVDFLKSVQSDVRLSSDAKQYIIEVVRDYYCEL